jgi:hypothetical protein
MKRLVALLTVCIMVVGCPLINANAAYVAPDHSSTDSLGGWKSSEWNDTSSRKQWVHAYTDCWSENFTTRYHEHVLYVEPHDSGNINRLTITVQPVYYSSGNNIGSQRKYEKLNHWWLSVNRQTISSGNQRVTVFATLETLYTTATYTYQNIYGV